MSRAKVLSVIGGVAAGALGMFASQANADVVMDIREAGSANKIINVTLNQVVHLEVYALISGTDGNLTNEGLQTSHGSIKTTGTAIKANGQAPSATVSPFDSLGVAGNGGFSDLDGDGDLDIGSNNNGSATGWVQVRAASMQIGQAFKVYTFDLLITAVSAGSTSVDWTYRTGATNQTWREDGVSLSAITANLPKLKSSSATLVFSAVPLPGAATMGLGLLGSLAVAARIRARRA